MAPPPPHATVLESYPDSFKFPDDHEDNNNYDDDDDYDDLKLSSDTLLALQSVLQEKEAVQKKFDELHRIAEERYAAVSMDVFEEDWQHSQFWYSPSTADSLSLILLSNLPPNSTIALLSAPTVYVHLRQMRSQGKIDPTIKLRLLEFDRRFEVFGDEFVFYDFATPVKGIPEELRGKCDRVLTDPPFLEENCHTKVSQTVRYLTKPWDLNTPPEDRPKIMLCTGERMRELLMKLYKDAGLRITDFKVRHQKGLANPFLCYSTWEDKEFMRFVEDDEVEPV